MKTYLSSLLLEEQNKKISNDQELKQSDPIFSFQVHLFTKEGIRKVEEFTFRANPCTVCIVRMSIPYGSTYHNCHTELLCDPLGQHHCKDHSQLYSLYNTKLRHSILKSSLSPGFEHEAWKRFSHSSHSRSLSDALQYFLHKPY